MKVFPKGNNYPLVKFQDGVSVGAVGAKNQQIVKNCTQSLKFLTPPLNFEVFIYFETNNSSQNIKDSSFNSLTYYLISNFAFQSFFKHTYYSRSLFNIDF